MPSPAQVARERERVRRAFDWWQKKLGWSYDIKVVGGALPAEEMRIGARCWPQDPKAFDVDFDIETIQDLNVHGIRELALHELGHAFLWPVAERATRGMTVKERVAWVEQVEEPVVYEWTRAVSKLALGRWSQR
jgi:hypothetical protein